ncbi:hypothetical protein V5799_015247 [Amblyomma americanum]|uniref:Uncharacterized protein n=1 Tax=Amblyomma americanum TaxID=6943 RepID=A0AAQ4E0P8_AMBAM
MLLLHELTSREDRQHPSVIDNTGIRGSPPGGPALHEVETGYDPVAWQQRSSKEHSLIVPDLVTADQPDSLVVNASAARVDAREDRQHPSVIDNTGIRGSPPGGPALHEVETGYDPINRIALSSMLLLHELTREKTGSTHLSSITPGIRGSPPGGPALHEVETGYDPVAWQQRSSKEHSLIVPDLVTADQPDSLVVNASAARVDAREDRQHPSVIDNTSIRGSPPGGPALHEVETGYDPINRIALSSMLLLHELTREKTGSTHLSSITPASGDRRQVDQRYTK